ncbi:MAG: hypothetical protein ACLR8H_11540 [Clostridium sp.]
MDAKSKANFINSVASRQKIPCPVCSTLNEFDSKYCYMCGAQLINASVNPENDEVTSKQCTTSLEKVTKTNETMNNAQKKDNTLAPFEPIEKSQMANDKAQTSKPAFDMFSVAETEEPEEISTFAQGLPSWDVVPPQIVIRRKKK